MESTLSGNKSMFKVFRILFVMTGFLPATYLTFLCLSVLASDLKQFHLICILGLLGYIGLFMLFIEEKINDWLIISLLTMGLFSFLLFNLKSKGILMEELIKFKDPIVSFTLIWPSIVSIFFIIRILRKQLKPLKYE